MTMRISLGTVSLLITAALLAGCKGSGPAGSTNHDTAKTRAVVTQTPIWQLPADNSHSGALRLDVAGNQFYFLSNGVSSYDATDNLRWVYTDPGGSFDHWAFNAGQIRALVNEYYQSGSPDRLYLSAIGQDGQQLWRNLMFETEMWVRTFDLVVAENAWTYFYYDTSRVSGDSEYELIAVDPNGEVAWTAKPTVVREERESPAYGYDSISLGPDGTVLALDTNQVAYRFDTQGRLLDSVPTSLYESWQTDGFIGPVTAQGTYLLSDRGNALLPWPYDYYSELPEYYVTGFLPESEQDYSDNIVFLDQEFAEQWNVESRSLVRIAAADSAGNLLVGGVAGEVTCFDTDGSELWRYVPDQQFEAQLSWDANGYEAPFIHLDTFVGVTLISVGPDGRIAVTTQSGLLYMLDAQGKLLWLRHGISGVPYRDKCYGIDPWDYAQSRGASGLAWDGTGNLLCNSAFGVLELDLSSGEIAQAMPKPYAEYLAQAADGSLRVAGGLLLAAVEESGSELWQATLPDGCATRPCVDENGTTYIATVRGGLTAIGVDGAVAWVIDLPERVLCYPSVGADGNVYMMTIDGQLLSVSPAGTIAWSLDGFNRDNLPPVCCPAGVAVVSGESTLAFVSYQGGSLWDFSAEHNLLAPPSTDAGSNVYFGDDRGVVYALDQTGTEIFRHVDQIMGRDDWVDGASEIRDAPLPLGDGGLIVAFASHPYYGDVYPVYNYSAVKQLSSTGDALWQVPTDEQRVEYYNASYLIFPGLIDGSWVLSHDFDKDVAASSSGEKLPLEVPDHFNGYYLRGRMAGRTGMYGLELGDPITLLHYELKFE